MRLATLLFWAVIFAKGLFLEGHFGTFRHVMSYFEMLSTMFSMLFREPEMTERKKGRYM
jgi:hypothetical protein